MHRREMSPIYRIAPCRWLSVIALLLSLPVLLAGQVGSFGGSLQSDNTYGPAVAADGSGGSTHKALPPAPEQMGDLLEREGHYQAAIEAYAQVLTPSAVVWNKLGICYQLLYDLKDAERCYKESLSQFPQCLFTKLVSRQKSPPKIIRKRLRHRNMRPGPSPFQVYI